MDRFGLDPDLRLGGQRTRRSVVWLAVAQGPAGHIHGYSDRPRRMTIAGADRSWVGVVQLRYVLTWVFEGYAAVSWLSPPGSAAAPATVFLGLAVQGA